MITLTTAIVLTFTLVMSEGETTFKVEGHESATIDDCVQVAEGLQKEAQQFPTYIDSYWDCR